MSDGDNVSVDQVRDQYLARAASCFDHLRIVSFGTATANYLITDRGRRRVHVTIEVKCYEIVEEKPSPKPPPKRSWWAL